MLPYWPWYLSLFMDAYMSSLDNAYPITTQNGLKVYLKNRERGRLERATHVKSIQPLVRRRSPIGIKSAMARLVTTTSDTLPEPKDTSSTTFFVFKEGELVPIVMRANGAREADNAATLFGEGKSYYTIEIIEETPITNAMHLLAKKPK